MEECKSASFGGNRIQLKTRGLLGIEQLAVDGVGLVLQLVLKFSNKAPAAFVPKRMNGYRYVEAVDVSRSH